MGDAHIEAGQSATDAWLGSNLPQQLTAWAARPSLTRCTRKRLGRVVDAVRSLMWRLLGIETSLRGSREELASILTLGEVRRLTPEFRLLSGKAEWEVFCDVVMRNEYRLPDQFQAEDVIIDIGAHVGCFSLAAVMRGAQRVYAFEPDAENFNRACAHLRPFADRVRLSQQAVWRSDRSGDRLFHRGSLRLTNTGGGSILWETEGQPLDVVAFDDVLRMATENGRRRVRLVKIDCESSEFPILLTSRLLHLVDAIHGEFHEVNDGKYHHGTIPENARVGGRQRFVLGDLESCLSEAGFVMQAERVPGSHMGLFFAHRPAVHAAQGKAA